MRTKKLGEITLDDAKLANELEKSRHFEYAEQYAEFQCGRRPWKTCMLWSRGGQVGDGVIAHYDTSKPAQTTVFGEQLPYLRELVERWFRVEHLLFARLVVMSDNVLVPHRDFIEFGQKPADERAAHRLHVPLATSDDALFMEENTIYRMLRGEVWSLDVSKMHSAAVLGDFRRVHLILDFADVPDAQVVKFRLNGGSGIPESNKVSRPALSDQERGALRGLANVVDDENLTEVFGIVLRKQYRKDGGSRYAWDAIDEIGRLSGDRQLHTRITDLYRHCMQERYE